MNEATAIDRGAGAYFVVLTPYATLGAQNYEGNARLVTRQGPSLADVQRDAPAGVRTTARRATSTPRTPSPRSPWIRSITTT